MIIIFGSVGSGKSEQAIRLAGSLGCPRISTSTLLHDRHNPAWEERIHNGELIKDDEVLTVLDEEISKLNPQSEEFILDGSPRSIKQAEWFLGKIKSHEIKLTAIIKLNVSKEVVLNRLMNRGREDDKEQVISKRLKDYETITNPVVDYLRQNGIAVDEVDGELSLDGVQQEIQKVLSLKHDS